MILRSLRLRLLALAALSIGAALVLAGFGLTELFERHVARRMDRELEVLLLQVASGVTIAPDGGIEMTKELSDPRFSTPYSGLYWQIERRAGDIAARSRSLWDSELSIPAKPEPGTLTVGGPGKTEVMARLRNLTFSSDKGDVALRVVVATDKAALEQAVDAFAGDVTPSLLLLAFVLLAASWLQVHLGLSPLEALRRGISAIRSGGAQRLDGVYPDEVTPLVQEANALLEAQDSTITQARARAADLAHGLKTPLTVLLGDARRLRDAGQQEIAAEIDGLAQTMQRHINHELARARIGGRVLGRGAAVSARDSLTQVIKTLQRTPRGEALSWDVNVPDGVMLPMDSTNAAELFGNLLENALKWAVARISVTATTGDHTRIVIADDGPGVAEEALSQLGERGMRLDMRMQGTGLGLAIVREIVSAHGGTVVFENRKPSGFVVTLTF